MNYFRIRKNATALISITLLITACAKQATSNQATPSPMASVTVVASSSPSASPTIAVTEFTDISDVFGKDQIEQLNSLGVFGSNAGSLFHPNEPILRRTYARWMFAANNAIVSDAGKMIHPASSADTATFSDLPKNDPDFGVIQGLQNSGISVGFPDKTFRPDLPITREQALSITALLTCDYKASFTGDNEPVGVNYLPDWKDKKEVSKAFVPVLAGCPSDIEPIIGRTWGKIVTFHPKQMLTRSQAALMLSRIGQRTAAQALADKISK